MALLYYDKDPNLQYFYNGSFELPVSTNNTKLNWVVDKSVRQADTVAFGSWALLLPPGESVYQEGSHLLFSHNVLVSVLAKGSLGLLCTIEVVSDSSGVTEWSRERVLKVNPLEFENTYALFRLPLRSGGVYTRVTFRNTGTEDIYLDNAKMEVSSRPTRYSPSTFKGDPQVEVPSVFQLEVEPEDPLTVSRPSITSTGFLPTVSNPSTTPGTTINGSPAPGPVIGGLSSPGFNQFKPFIIRLRGIYEEERDQAVNRKEQRFFPKEFDPEFLKFDRSDLSNVVDDYASIGSTQRSSLMYAKNKMASLRRAYESRVHSRCDYYAFDFIDKYLMGKYLREEEAAVRELAGAR